MMNIRHVQVSSDKMKKFANEMDKTSDCSHQNLEAKCDFSLKIKYFSAFW